MRIDLVSLFPEFVAQIAGHGVVGRATERGLLSLHGWNPRDHADGNYRRVDDRPFGGGPGMVMLIDPLRACLAAARAAEALRGSELWVARTALPPPAAGEYYWVDLEGLRVTNVEGAEFGTVSHLFSTAANDVLVARGDRERMIPFLMPDYVRAVDFDAGVVIVDWDPEF